MAGWRRARADDMFEICDPASVAGRVRAQCAEHTRDKPKFKVRNEGKWPGWAGQYTTVTLEGAFVSNPSAAETVGKSVSHWKQLKLTYKY